MTCSDFHNGEAPATKVVRLFDGPAAVAELLGISKVQVYRWSHPIEKGGCGGLVPPRHHKCLLEEAQKRGLGLELADLMTWLRDEDAA